MSSSEREFSGSRHRFLFMDGVSQRWSTQGTVAEDTESFIYSELTFPSDAVRKIFDVANNSLLCSIVAILGIVSNVLNVAVFYRQGFRTTVNISLTGLAVADLGSLVTLLWFNLCVNPLFVNAGLPMVPFEVQHLSGGWPHGCFVRITGWITVFVTAERCLCVTAPLKVRRIITPRRTAFAVATIYTLIILSLLPEYAPAYIGWKFYPRENRTLLGIVFTDGRDRYKGIVPVVYSLYLLLSFVALIVFTVALIVEMNIKTKWRRRSTSDRAQAESISKRDQRVVSMVVLIAGFLIICRTPFIILNIVELSVAEFSVVGRFTNLFFITWSLAFLFGAINSSCGIVLYYRMSTKYRKTFKEILRIGTTLDKNST